MSSIDDFLGKAHNNHFSNAVVTWEVERFSLITLNQKMICSPLVTLQGPVQTQWKMYLDKTKKNNLLLKVELLPNKTEIGKLKLEWAFCLLDENEQGNFTSARTYTYEPKTVLVLENLSLKHVLQIVNKKKYDNLILKFKMLVTFGLKVTFPNAKVDGIMELSNSLLNLPKKFLHHDIITTVSEVDFSLHKAMLFMRGRNLERFFEQSSCNMKVNFSLSNAKAAHAVFTYLYSGNLRFILENPSLTICDYIQHLDIPEVKNVYSPQIIKAASKVELKEHEICWSVADFKNISRTVIGPKFKIDGLKSEFQICLNVKESKENESKYLHVEITLHDTENILVLSFEFSCGKDENEMVNSKRVHGIMGQKDRLSATLLEDDCPEIKQYFEIDNLLIKAKVYIRMGEVVSDIVENRKPATADITCERSFMNLSKSMGKLKKSCVYSDFHFEVGEQQFNAHKFLVAARSPLMNELLRKHGDLISVKVHNFTAEVFEKFLSYMYIGILTENDGDKLMELYNLSDQYQVYGILEVVPRVLAKCINEANMLRVLIFADDIENDDLANTALDYVVSKLNIFKNHEDRDKLNSKKPKIYEALVTIMAED